jgi:DnaJ family protein A protein 2
LFKEINAAYEILSDPDQRAKYDKYGLEGLTEGGGGRGGGGAEDLFSMFFGGARGRPSAPKRGDDVNHPIEVQLEDLYKGKTIKLAITRQVMVGDPRMCRQCNGQGLVVELRQIGLGMVQQVQRHCASCEGEGYICKKKSERKVLEVLVEKGMKHNQKIVFKNMADEKPNMEAGHVNFVIQEKAHALFKRKGADLLISKTLSLKEALCGFSWSIPHLDGRQVVIQSRPGEVIQAEGEGGRPFVKRVAGEGMPSHGNPFVKGSL